VAAGDGGLNTEGKEERFVLRLLGSGVCNRYLDPICVTELPATIELLPGKVIIHCKNMEHLLQQLVQLAKTLDNDCETLQRRVEPAPLRRPAGLRGCHSCELVRRGRGVKQIDPMF
jgi:hypothetical protein